MNQLSELFLKLKLGVEETKRLDLGEIDTVISALQSNNEEFDETTIENILEAVVALLEIDEPESKARVLMLIAEIAKSEETRVPCVKVGLIATILSNLESEDPNIVLQSLRAIGNISYENELAKSALAEHKGAEKIVKKLGVLEKSFDENSDNKLELAACGSMLNVASDDEALTEEAVSFGAVSFLLGFVKQSLHSNPALCQMALSAVSVLVFSDKGKASFSESDGVAILMKVVQESEDEEMIDTIFEIFKSLIVDDNVKKVLVQHGYAEHLANIVSSSKDAAEDESLKEKLQSAADMIVMLLTEDGSMKVLFSDGNGSVYKLCVSWLSSGDQHLEISGCLAVGNFGRTDEHCIKLVEQGVHVQLLQLLSRTTKKENMGRHQQAVFSALKNLAMPADVANRIVSSKEHLSTLVRCCESSGHEGVRSKASRMLSVIVKQARTAEVSQQIMKGGGLAPIVAMISSEHVIMQNEALIALTVMSSTVEDNLQLPFNHLIWTTQLLHSTSTKLNSNILLNLLSSTKEKNSSTYSMATFFILFHSGLTTYNFNSGTNLPLTKILSTFFCSFLAMDAHLTLFSTGS